MKRFLTAGVFTVLAAAQAMAADLPQPMPPPRAPAVFVPPPVYNWSGIYIGGNAGGAWVNQDPISLTDQRTGSVYPGASTKSTGFAGGGQIGFNYQINQLVLGAEVDADYLSNTSTVNGVTTFPAGPTPNGTDQTKYTLDFFSTVRARAGIAVDRILFYGTGGLAMGEYKQTRTQQTGTLNNAGPGASDSDSDLRLGWTAGAGVEAAVTDNWTVRVEYLYASLESENFTYALAQRNIAVPSETVNLLRAGVNFKF